MNRIRYMERERGREMGEKGKYISNRRRKRVEGRERAYTDIYT